MVIVDAHHHFWNLDRVAQPWLTDEHAAIARTFEPPDLEPLLAPSGIEQTVLVQSASLDADTDTPSSTPTRTPGSEAWLPGSRSTTPHERVSGSSS